MTSELIPVNPNNPYPLGRAGIHHDPKNWDFRALVTPPPRRPFAPFGWPTKDIFDQGNATRCTVENAVGQLRTYPFRSQSKLDWPQYDEPWERQNLYLAAQKVDPWEGESYDGTSTDAPFRILRDRGVITSWKWLFGEEEFREYLMFYGPAGVGTMWTEGMFNPDSKGYIYPTGAPAGGHAYRIVQYSQKRDAYRIANSWGKGWGINGRAWINSVDLAALLRDDGEAVAIGDLVR